jgi:hypothetical protein
VTADPLPDGGLPAPEPLASGVPPGGLWPATGGSPVRRRPFPPVPPRPPYRPPPKRNVWSTVALVASVVLAVCGLALVGMFVLILIAIGGMASNK